MKYETPQLTALTNAVDAIQGNGVKTLVVAPFDGRLPYTGVNEHIGAGYADWE